MVTNVIVAGNNMLFNETLKLSLSTKGYRVFIAKKKIDALYSQIKDDDVRALILDEAISEEKHELIIELSKKISPYSKSIFLLSSRSLFLMAQGLTNGISGFVHQQGGVSELDNCIKKVLTGHLFISPKLAGVQNPPVVLKKKKIPLTSSEEKILKYVAQNKSNKQIGNILEISPRTVENHRYNICKKLGLKGYNTLYDYARLHY